MSNYCRESLFPEINFNTVKVFKFKTMRISVYAFLPIEKESVHLYPLLSKAMTRSCDMYPDFTVLSKKLSSLYGASLACSSSKLGDILSVGFHIAGLDDRYTINKEKLSCELSNLLCEVIFNPKAQNERFDSESLLQAKRETIDSIDAEFNEKRTYAINKSIEIMCSNEAYGLSKYGSKEDVEKVNEEDIFVAWKNLLKNARFEIFYTGDSDSCHAKEIFIDYFKNIERTPLKLENKIIRNVEKIKEVEESMPLSQSKMILGFRTDSSISDDDMYVTKLMCAILGGTAHSKLFNNVREKLSLCYYCASRFTKQKGIMLVDCGVEKDNISKTKEAILNEIEEMKKGNISFEEIESTKLSLTNAFRESLDLASGVETWYYSQVFDKDICSVEKICEKINSITKEEIVKVSNKLKLDTIFTLVGTGE